MSSDDITNENDNQTEKGSFISQLDILLGGLHEFKVPTTCSRYTIYIIECNGVYKIGSTSNIKSRLITIQTSNPNPISIVHAIPIPISYEHREVEKALHTIFANVHSIGEWYNLCPQDIERIKTISIDDILQTAQKMRVIKDANDQKQSTLF